MLGEALSVQTSEKEKYPEISLGHYQETRAHPETGEMLPCLIVYIPYSISLNLQKNNGGPTHYTPGAVHLEGLDSERIVSIGSDAMDNDGKAKEIPAETEEIILDGCFSVRLNDANPPLDPSGREIYGKVVHYLVENTAKSRLVATVKKCKWIDRTGTDGGKNTDREIICQGSVLMIFGSVNRVVDPWNLPRDQKFDHLRRQAENIYNRWNRLKIARAKKSAIEISISLLQKGVVKYQTKEESDRALNDLTERLEDLNK